MANGRHLRPRACRSRDENFCDGAAGNVVHPQVIEYRPAVSCNDGGAFGNIHRAAAPQADKGVYLVFAGQFGTFIHGKNVRLRLNFIEGDDLQVRPLQQVRQSFQDSGPGYARIRDDANALAGKILQHLGQFRQRAVSEYDRSRQLEIEFFCVHGFLSFDNFHRRLS